MKMRKTKVVVSCAICKRYVAPGTGFRNAHAVVCSWKCSGTWNQIRNVSYAWGPNR